MRNLIKQKINKLFENSYNYSGKYIDLYDFLVTNGLEQLFVEKYNKFDANLTIQNWEDFVRGEMGTDEEIIEVLIGDEYKIYYDEDEDVFIITKKKTGKINYKIELSNSEEIIKVLDMSGVYSEYNPRFAVKLNNNIIGGSTYKIDYQGVYNFDIGILDEYQGYGISVNLIKLIISDAKKMKANGIKAQVVNNVLFDYLIKNGFKGANDGGVKYVFKKLISENKTKYISDDVINYINKFDSDEQLLRSGGLPIDILDKLAHGFSEEDIKILHPKQLKIMWKDDYENVLWEIKKSGLTPKQWASKINLSEPIDVDYMVHKNKKGFFIQDGHHRYVAAKILNKPLNVNLEIKLNPIKELSNLSYDDFHRELFKKSKK